MTKLKLKILPKLSEHDLKLHANGLHISESLYQGDLGKALTSMSQELLELRAMKAWLPLPPDRHEMGSN